MTDETTLIADPSIILTRLTVENFRALGYAVLEPLTDGGMTAINGVNGAGKSSLLVALCWCLYGVTPDGVSAKNLRRQGSEGLPCRVIINFSHHGQNIEVERGMKGKNDAAYARVSVDGVEQIAGKVSVANAWVNSRLGAREAFLTSFVIRQKELDQLVQAPPSERRALIERLAGIDRMSAAVKNARVEENDAKKKLQYLPESSEDVQRSAEAVKENAQLHDESMALAEKARLALQNVEEKYELESNEHNENLKKADDIRTIQQRIVEVKGGLQRIDDTVDFHNTRITELESVDYSPLGNKDSIQTQVETKTQELQAARELYTNIVSTRKQYDSNKASLESQQQRLAQEESTLESRKELLQDFDRLSVDKEIVSVEESIDNAQAQINQLRATMFSSDSQINEVSASIELLSKSDKACCPTCAQDIPDVREIVKKLTSTLSVLKKTKADSEKQIATLSKKVHKDQLNKKGLESNIARFEKESYQIEQAEKSLVSLRSDIKELTTKLSRDEKEITKMQKNFDKVDGQALSAEVKELEKILTQMSQLENNKKELETLLDKRDKFLESRVKGETQLNSLQKELSSIDINEETIKSSEIKVKNLLDEKVALQLDYNNHKNTVINAKADYDRAKQALVEATAREQARLEAIRDYEYKSAVTDALDMFRKDRISRISPELSEIGTELIVKMTEGKYVSMELSEDFTPIVTDRDGNERPVSWLSGGEESNVALALRLAIGELISGSQGGLLWMDEPQAAMDEARRPAMMAAIREMEGRQPIIISHASEASDMVDMIFDVIPNAQDGSTLALNDGESVGQISDID